MKIYQVDAFAEKLFKGNPAAVCILNEWLPNETMQQIGMENNLAETAFVVNRGSFFEIRWFTPTVEVELCGHATLASAFVLFNYENYRGNTISFLSRERGELKVFKEGDYLFLDFPADMITPFDVKDQIKKCTGIEPIETYKGMTDCIALFSTEKNISDISPDFYEISKLDARGLVVTAKGNEVDFVSRFFAPQSGIDEDPVTGSAHTSLIPIWASKLNKTEMKARQLSKRGGELHCIKKGDRCIIGGKCVLFMSGEIKL